MKSKRCERCNRKLPLFMFAKDRRKYQIPTTFGKVRSCRTCVWKQTANQNKVVRFDFQTNKFELVVLTFKQRLKELFRK